MNFTPYQTRLDAAIDHYLPKNDSLPVNLPSAMRYVMSNQGKRIRPLLVYFVGQLFNGSEQGLAQLDAPACAIECIHSYSLVHDDLPAMDDANLRRGKASCHTKFDEATAILVGDALQALAFEILATAPGCNPEQRNTMVRVLAKACGPLGMVGGQAIDLSGEQKSLTQAEIETMHRLKTGALIRASVELGAIAGGCDDEEALSTLLQFASSIGLAFQIQDDLLDCLSNTVTLGKPAAADAELDKSNYARRLGVDAAKRRLESLHEEANQALRSFGDRASNLIHFNQFLLKRSY